MPLNIFQYIKSVEIVIKRLLERHSFDIWFLRMCSRHAFSKKKLLQYEWWWRYSMLIIVTHQFESDFEIYQILVPYITHICHRIHCICRSLGWHIWMALEWDISHICHSSEVPIVHSPLHWRHNGRDCISNHQPNDCLLNRLFRRRSKKTSKLCVTGLCEGNSPGTGEFLAQMTSNAENVSIWWRHHAIPRP